MKRLTVKKEVYQSEATRQELIDALGHYEDFTQAFVELKKSTRIELEHLKNEEKTKTLHYKELFGQKIWTQAILDQLIKWGFVDRKETEE